MALIGPNLFRSRRGRGHAACLGFGPLRLWLNLQQPGYHIRDRSEFRHVIRLQAVQRQTGIPIIRRHRGTWVAVPDVDWDAVARYLGIRDFARSQKERHAEDRRLFESGVPNKNRDQMKLYDYQRKRRAR